MADNSLIPNETIATPGLTDLLGDCLTFADPQLAKSAANNVHLPTIQGIAAISELLWWAAQHEDFGSSKDCKATLADVGQLIRHLAETAHTMHTITANASFQISQGAGHDN